MDVVCFIWDFDKTLILGYMQDPLFKHYGVDAKSFWDEVNSLPKQYASRGIAKVNRDTIYLNHMITYAHTGRFQGLSNAVLQSLGAELEFYPGLPDFFKEVKERIETDSTYREYGVTVEHYIVSTGLAAMIEGSKVRPYVDGVWGCEFIEHPIGMQSDGEQETSVISQIAYAIDNTSKTRAIFEIKKGANKFPEIDVNAAMPLDRRRVPFSNMIYVADGPSDVPSFSVVQQYGGRTYAVYPRGNLDAFKQAEMLRKDRRIDMYGEADYSPNTQTHMWLTQAAVEIADSIVRRKKEAILASASTPPTHLI